MIIVFLFILLILFVVKKRQLISLLQFFFSTHTILKSKSKYADRYDLILTSIFILSSASAHFTHISRLIIKFIAFNDLNKNLIKPETILREENENIKSQFACRNNKVFNFSWTKKTSHNLLNHSY